MTRRTFLHTSTMLGAAAVLPMTSCQPPQKYKLGYQLFSVNEDMNRDPLTTLQALKSMGYEDFETFGFEAEKGTYYGYPAEDFKKRLEDLELTITSGHYSFATFLGEPAGAMARFTDQCIQGALALQKPYITWPWIAPEQRTLENYKRMAASLNVIGEQVAAAGLSFAYHNHGFEFIPQEGETCYDIILRETDPDLVKLQLDMYWLMHDSTMTPADLIKQQAGRFVMWHIKDMHKVSRDYTELGNGSIDYRSLLPDSAESGLEYYYLEQGGNFTHDALTSAADSAAYFKRNLQQLI